MTHEVFTNDERFISVDSVEDKEKFVVVQVQQLHLPCSDNMLRIRHDMAPSMHVRVGMWFKQQRGTYL